MDGNRLYKTILAKYNVKLAKLIDKKYIFMNVEERTMQFQLCV